MPAKDTVRLTIDLPKELHHAVKLWAIQMSTPGEPAPTLADITRSALDRATWDTEFGAWIRTDIQRRTATRTRGEGSRPSDLNASGR